MSIFETMRADPVVPVTLSPLAAADGSISPDDGSTPVGIDLSFFVSLGASLGSLVDTMRADQDRRTSMMPPSNEQLFSSAVATSSGIVTLDLGSVPQGRVWQIRRLVVGGITVGTAADGKAYAFAQGAPPSDQALTDCVGIYAALPTLEKFGTHQLFLQAPEHLWVVFTGASNGQQYAASARVEDWDDAAFRSTFAE